MAVNGVGQTSSTANTTATATTTKTLGQDAFLQLLTTQLAHQDPTAPQDNSQMIAQLAQFSSLEQLTNIDATLGGMASAMGVTVPDPKTATTTKKA
jgi:flagellar basal-body rod modification protein FlgD